jgi:hypothetical protein
MTRSRTSAFVKACDSERSRTAAGEVLVRVVRAGDVMHEFVAGHDAAERTRWADFLGNDFEHSSFDLMSQDRVFGIGRPVHEEQPISIASVGEFRAAKEPVTTTEQLASCKSRSAAERRPTTFSVLSRAA